MSEPTVAAQPTVPFFKKRTKTKPLTARRRSPSPSSVAGPSTEPPSVSEVVIPTKKTVANPLVQGTKRTRTDREKEDREGPDVNWSSAGSKARAEAGMELAAEEAEEMEEELRKKVKRDANGGYDPDEDDGPDDGTYKGQAGYKKLIKTKQEVPKAARVGPQRSTNTIRTVTLVDYQPDVCKDYKETGYCGFGDTCKFLHDRGTYLAGWQLDKLAASSGKKITDDDSSDSSDEEEDILWACFICRKSYTDPIVTRCGHYFCCACAIKRFARTPKCAACGQPTGGIFNKAEKVIDKMRAKRAAEEAAAAAEEAEEPVAQVKVEGLGESSDDDDSD